MLTQIKKYQGLFVTVVVIAAMLLAGCSGSPNKGNAEKYPTKPITMIVNIAVGGGVDMIARAIAPYMEKELGQPVVVQNVTEANGIKGVMDVYQAKPDGYTLLALILPRTAQAEIAMGAQYKTMDFSYIYNIDKSGFVLVTSPNSPIKSFEDFQTQAKVKELNVGVTGLGTATHLQTAMLEKALDVKFAIVPFQGAAPAMAAAMGGQIDASVIPLDTAAGSLSQLRVLANLQKTRHAKIQDTPSLTDLGIPEAEGAFYNGIVAPPNLPADIKDALVRAVDKAMKDPEFQDKATKMGHDLFPLSGDEYKAEAQKLYQISEEYKEMFMKK